MTDLERARAFVSGKVDGTGAQFDVAVAVLVNKLAAVREEGTRSLRIPGNRGESWGGPALACLTYSAAGEARPAPSARTPRRGSAGCW